MRILIISRGIPSKQDPQWGSFEFDQAKALTALGHDVIMASVDTRFRLFWRKFGMSTCTIDGVKAYNLFVCPSAIVGLLGRRVRERYTAWLWHKMESTLIQNEGKIDVIYPHYLNNTYFAVNYLQNIHAPVVAIEHWSAVNQPTIAKDIQAMGEDAYPKVDQLITVSKAAQDSIKRHFGKESVVVHNMVSRDFQYVAKQNTKKKKLTFISIGSLRPLKGFDTLVKAFAGSTIPKEQWELLIIGNGTEQRHIQTLIRQTGQQDNIHLLGQKSSAEIRRLLTTSDVFVLASRSETFGVVYVEAMACGLPVIATRCGGPQEFVTEANGLLVDVDDIKALTDAIHHMHAHYADYDHEAIAAECQRRFSSEVIARQLTEIFENTVAHPQANKS